MEIISMAEAKSRFSELVSRTAAGERFIIRRRERPLAILISPDEMERLERNSRAAHRLAMALGQDEGLMNKIESRQTHPVMAAFSLWRSDPVLENLVDEIYRARKTSEKRPGVGL
jgi:prevent-host-death family protein